jgi:uncharacterized protein YndB with AHSA1/START domain
MRFSLVEWIDAPPQQVWSVATDIERMQAWMNNLVRIEVLTDGGFRPGARWREVRKMYGKEAAEEFEVRTAEPPSAFTLYVDGSKGASKRGEYLFEHRLVSENGGTRFEVDGEISGMGLMGKIIGPLMKGAFKKAMLKDLASMKEFIEGTAD